MPSNVVRLPRPPRRRQEEIGAAPRWSPAPEGAYDPAETRPVSRAALERESGSIPVDGPAQAAAEAGGNSEREASPHAFEASRRNRDATDKRPGDARRRGGP